MESDLFEKDTDYVLVEESSTDELQFPLKRSNRLKYNCLSVSTKLVAIGSNTGGIYVFSRSDQKLLQIAFAEKETGSVSTVKISPHEKFVAFISSSNVHVVDLRLESRSKAETLKSSNSQVGCSVTCLQWDHSSTKLYVGDDLGNVSMMSVSSSKTKNIFSLPLEVIMKLDSVIVQIDNVQDKILVSTLTRCYLCHTTKQQYSQIGQRLRDGHYGACFLQQPMCAPMIYCARPGSRIWEVDFEGTVLNTHQFKQLLSISPRKITNIDRSYEQFVSTDSYPPQAVAFPKLTVFRSRYLLTWTSSCLYVLDPINVKVILWTNQFSDIQDVCCVDCDIYVFFKSMTIDCISFLPVTSVLPLYLKVNNLDAAANMCLSHRQIFAHKHVRKRFDVTEMSKLYNNLVSSDMNGLAEMIKDIITDVEEKIAAETELEKSGFVRSCPNNAMSEKNLPENDTTESSGETENCLRIAQEPLTQNGIEKLDSERVIDKQHEIIVDDDSVVNITQNGVENEFPDVTVNELDTVETYALRTLNSYDDKLGNETIVVKNNGKSEQLIDPVGAMDVNKDQYIDFESANDVGHDLSNNENDRPTVSTNHSSDICDSESILRDLEVEQNCSHTDPGETDLAVPKLLVPDPPLRTISPLSMDMSDDLLIEDEDDVGYLPKKGMGTRRLSSTSLSSLSSAEVFEEPSHSFENESTDPIAMPVRRRSGRKKARRKSAIDLTSSGNVAVKRSLSSGSGKSKSSSKDMALSPQGSVRSLKEEDSISVYSNDSFTMEDGTVAILTTGTKDEDIPDGISEIKSTESVHESHVSCSEDFSHSGEFGKSGDYLQSGELSPGESTQSQSLESNKQGPLTITSSAPKAALMQFKNKMQNKVSTKTKGLIRNIKEKNLLSKAKEIAGNLSQGSEAYLYSGEVPFIENPSLQMPPGDIEGAVKNVNDLSLEETNEDIHKVSIDLTDLQEITEKTVEMLQDVAILCDSEAVEGVLEDWINVLNAAFQALHIEKYGQIRNDTPRDNMNEADSREMHSMHINDGSPASKLDDNETFNTHANLAALEPKKTTALPNLKIEKDKSKIACGEIATILEGSDFCYIKDPLYLPQDLLCQICDLVQACFGICCHGNLLMYINFDQNETNICDKSSSIHVVCGNNQCDVDTVKDCDLDVKHEETSSKDTKPNEHNIRCGMDNILPPDNIVHVEFNNYTSSGDDVKCQKKSVPGDFIQNEAGCDKSCRKRECNSAKTNTGCGNSVDSNVSLDYVMGLFVRCYFPYLDVSKIREQSRRAESCFYVWSALATCMEEKSSFDAEKFGVEEKSLISYMIENQAHCDDGAALIGHVSKLLRNNHCSIVDICVRCHPYIQPLDVMYLCRYHQVAMDTVYKQYIHLMTERVSTASRKEVLYHLSEHTEPALAWLNMLLTDDQLSSKVLDEDGCPRCMSHTMPWRYNSIINEFVDIVITEDVRRQLVELFRKHGYWVGVLKIVKKSGSRQEHLLLVLQLGDVNLLSEDGVLGYQPQCEAEWEELITMFGQLSSDARNQPLDEMSSDWSNMITWDNLAILLVKNVGADAAVSMLERHNVSEQMLSTHFYQACLLSGMVEKQQRLILHSMLEKVDTYLWSQRPTALNPQIQYLALTERKVSITELVDVHSDEVPNMVNHIQKQNLHLYVEDSECHWGIESKINMLCKCCYIALRDIVSHEEPGVLVFKCGHSFHKICLPGKECPFCVDRK